MTGASYRMQCHAHRILPAAAALAVSFFASTVTGAAAGEAAYCVTCKGPDQTYLCRVTGDDLRRNDALKLYCVERTAKEGGHASCGAKDDASRCNGVERTYSLTGEALPSGLTNNPSVEKLTARAAREQKAFAKPKDEGGPQTLAEVTGRAFSASRRGLRNVRSSFGGGQDTSQSSPPAGALPSAPTLTPEIIGEPAPRNSRIRRGAQNAGAAMGHFARNGYRCVRSFFRQCRGAQDEAPAN
jgi:hypothetical protein